MDNFLSVHAHCQGRLHSECASTQGDITTVTSAASRDELTRPHIQRFSMAQSRDELIRC